MDGIDTGLLDALGVPALVIGKGTDGTPVFTGLNAAFLAISGFSRVQVLDRTPGEVFGPAAGAEMVARYEPVLASGTARTSDAVLRVPLGARAVRSTVRPLVRAGRVVAVVETLVDVAGLVRAEVAPVAAASGLDREHFIAMAAHDLRAPMRQVQQLAEMLRQCAPDDEADRAELIDMLDDVSARSAALVSEVLSYAQTRGPAASSREVVELGQLCADVFATLDPMGLHALKCDHRRVETDKTALQIVLRNLVENAIKHGGRERISVSVALDGEDESGLTFVVRDDGRGFDAPSLAFLSGGTFTRECGFGLLGIRQLIESRGGSIRAVRPASGTGAEVRFTLPGEDITDPEIAPERVPAAGAPAAGRDRVKV